MARQGSSHSIVRVVPYELSIYSKYCNSLLQLLLNVVFSPYQVRVKYSRALKKGEHQLKIFLLNPTEKEVRFAWRVISVMSCFLPRLSQAVAPPGLTH